jgi:hypothetical protein
MSDWSRITTAKVALAVIGLITFGYGMRVDHEPLRWIGIGFLAAAFLLRFLPGGRTRRH